MMPSGPASSLGARNVRDRAESYQRPSRRTLGINKAEGATERAEESLSEWQRTLLA